MHNLRVVVCFNGHDGGGYAGAFDGLGNVSDEVVCGGIYGETQSLDDVFPDDTLCGEVGHFDHWCIK